MPHTLSSYHRTVRRSLVALAFALLAPLALLGQNPPKKEINDRIASRMQPLQEYVQGDTPNYQAALNLIDELLATQRPEPFDILALNQIKVQVLLTMQRYTESIAPLETTLDLGRRYDFMAPKQLAEFTLILAQLYFQEATESRDPELKMQYFQKAYDTTKVVLSELEKPTADQLAFAASVIYTLATADEDNLNKELLNDARDLAREGILMSAKPRENFYVFILQAYMEEGNNAEAAKILEILVDMSPDSSQYWSQLQATYIGLAAAAEDRDDTQAAYEYNLRVVHTIQRAQDRGLLDDPRDHFNLIGILMNIKRFHEAIDLMERDLASGKVENTQRNWELLASSYQQVHQQDEAIDALERASKLFPTAGSLDFQIANIYYAKDDLRDSYRFAKSSLDKGNLDNRASTQMFTAYIGYELREYEEALVYAKEAEAAGVQNADKLRQAIEDAIADRAAALAATIR